MKDQQYVKKPIPVGAVQLSKVFKASSRNGNSAAVVPTGIAWVDEAVSSGFVYWNDQTQSIFVRTLEGEMQGRPHDYLVHGVRGELYICERSIFEETYEPVG